MTTKDDLVMKLATAHAAAKSSAHLAELQAASTTRELLKMQETMLALAAGEVVEDPSKEDPPPPVEVDPGGYGCQVPVSGLADWQFAAVTGAGRPASVAPFASHKMMLEFRFHPRPGDLATDKGIASGAEKGIVGVDVMDSVIDGFKPWGLNHKGVYSARFVRNTTRGLYGTGEHIEHGRYLGVEGPSPDAMQRGYAGSLAYIPEDLRFNPANPHADGAAIWMKSEFFENCPGAGYQEVNRDLHKGKTEAHNPATFDADAGATWIEATRFLNCGMGHPAATISLFAAQHSGSGDAMRRANKAVLVTDTIVEAFALPQYDLKPKSTLLMVAGKQSIYIEGGAYRRDDMGATMRSFWSLGDGYAAPYAGWSRPGAPATDGGPIIVRDVSFWSAQPARVSIDMMDGTPLEWRGCKLESDSAPIRLVVNGVDVGSVEGEVKP